MDTNSASHFCSISGVELSPERVEALESLGVPPDKYTSVSVASRMVTRRRAAISNEDGAFLIVDRLEDDVPLSVLDPDDDKAEPPPDTPESAPPETPRPAPTVEESPLRSEDEEE